MPDDTPDLSIPADKLCFIIAKAREFDVKDVVTFPTMPPTQPTTRWWRCWRTIATIRSCRSLSPSSSAMSEDEQIDLVTLTWLGRGDGSIEDWSELRAKVARAHNRRTAAYLLGFCCSPITSRSGDRSSAFPALRAG